MTAPSLSAIVVANGKAPTRSRLRQLARSADFVLAADGGASHLAKAGLTPDAIIGDFDSIASDLLPGVKRISAPSQEYTDLDKALQYLRSSGYERVSIVCATGGRLDHTFGALSALIKYSRSLDLCLVDNIAVARVVGRELKFGSHVGQTISLMPVGEVDSVTTSGLKWNLSDERLASGTRDGTSNEATGSEVCIQTASGDLVVYVHTRAIWVDVS